MQDDLYEVCGRYGNNENNINFAASKPKGKDLPGNIRTYGIKISK
jgi:hypothetical protein